MYTGRTRSRQLGTSPHHITQPMEGSICQLQNSRGMLIFYYIAACPQLSIHFSCLLSNLLPLALFHLLFHSFLTPLIPPLAPDLCLSNVITITSWKSLLVLNPRLGGTHWQSLRKLNPVVLLCYTTIMGRVLPGSLQRIFSNWNSLGSCGARGWIAKKTYKGAAVYESTDFEDSLQDCSDIKSFGC